VKKPEVIVTAQASGHIEIQFDGIVAWLYTVGTPASGRTLLPCPVQKNHERKGNPMLLADIGHALMRHREVIQESDETSQNSRQLLELFRAVPFLKEFRRKRFISLKDLPNDDETRLLLSKCYGTDLRTLGTRVEGERFIKRFARMLANPRDPRVHSDAMVNIEDSRQIIMNGLLALPDMSFVTPQMRNHAFYEFSRFYSDARRRAAPAGKHDTAAWGRRMAGQAAHSFENIIPSEEQRRHGRTAGRAILISLIIDGIAEAARCYEYACEQILPTLTVELRLTDDEQDRFRDDHYRHHAFGGIPLMLLAGIPAGGPGTNMTPAIELLLHSDAGPPWEPETVAAVFSGYALFHENNKALEKGKRAKRKKRKEIELDDGSIQDVDPDELPGGDAAPNESASEKELWDSFRSSIATALSPEDLMLFRAVIHEFKTEKRLRWSAIADELGITRLQARDRWRKTVRANVMAAILAQHPSANVGELKRILRITPNGN
jgi:hypothetical protein